MLLLTAGLALLVAESVPISYQAQGTILFEPPTGAPATQLPSSSDSSSFDPSNPFAETGAGEIFAARLMVTVMSNHAVQDGLKAKGASSFTVTQDDDSLPLLNISAEAATAQQALSTLHIVSDEVSQELQSQQQQSTVKPENFISVRPLLPTDKADPLYGGRIRAGLAVGLLGIAAALSIPFVMEGINRSRRRRPNADRPDEWPGGNTPEWTDQIYAELPPLESSPEERPPVRLSDLRD
jgi:hypothetical protein